MPESKGRKAAEDKKKGAKRAGAAERRPESKRGQSLADKGNWVAPTFITLMLLGVLWLVVWYITAATGVVVPLLTDLGSWNLAVGMGLMVAGFAVATQWK